MSNDVSQTQEEKYLTQEEIHMNEFHSYVDSNKVELIETQSRMVVIRSWKERQGGEDRESLPVGSKF
jgi:hypothetical protein